MAYNDMRIHVEEEGLVELRRALETAGEEYKLQLARLTNLIEEITIGDIQGDLADDLLMNFKAKEEDFKSLARTIEEVEEKIGIKGQDFTTMVEGLKEEAK